MCKHLEIGTYNDKIDRVLAKTPTENKANDQSRLQRRVLQKLGMMLLLLEISLELLKHPASVHCISKLLCEPDGGIMSLQIA